MQAIIGITNAYNHYIKSGTEDVFITKEYKNVINLIKFNSVRIKQLIDNIQKYSDSHKRKVNIELYCSKNFYKDPYRVISIQTHNELKNLLDNKQFI